MERQTPWTLEISEDRMSARLCVSEDFLGDPQKLRTAIIQTGIVFGITDDGIAQALSSRGTPVIVASGQPPTAGIDDDINLFISQEDLTGRLVGGVGEDLRITYEVPSVQPGQVIAELHPGKAGEAGTDIYGKKVPPARIKQIRLVTLGGTALSENGYKVIAASVGRPRLEIHSLQYRFQVLPVHIHKNDVTLETAHLKFDGDIVVRGSVMEGTSVQATGNVEVLGNVDGATVKAGQSVQIAGNVIKSKIEAGFDWKPLAEQLPLLEETIKTLSEITVVLEQLEEQGKLNTLPLAVLAEKIIKIRHPGYHDILQRLAGGLFEATKKIPALTGTFNLKELLMKLNYQNWQKLSDVPQAASQALLIRTQIEHIMESRANIRCAYALNASIRASGKITIFGQGSFHSQLAAHEEVEISGIIRGGDISAEHVITAGLVGSEAGAQTTMRVGKRGYMLIQKAFENTIFIVGESKLKLTHSISRCRVTSDRDGLVHLKPGY